MKGIWVGFVVTLWSGSAFAGPPTIRELRPWGAQRGQTITLTIVGDQLDSGSEMFSGVPGKLHGQAGGNGAQLTVQLEVAADAAVGVYPIRLRTSGGLSNVLLFSVGDLPEVAESEPNDTIPATASTGALGPDASAPAPIPLPATVNGSIVGTDQDVFRFAARKGDRILLEAEAHRIGSPLDPALRLFNTSGHELAFVDDTPGSGLDCRIDVTIPEDGHYLAAIHDSKYAGASPGYYRLKVGTLAYAEMAFPLGGQRGHDVDVTWSGGTLREAVTTKVLADAGSGTNRLFSAPPVSGPQTQLPFRFYIGDAPELLEPQSDAIDDRWFKDAGVMNGRISRPGEADRYKFPVAAGQTWVFEVDAANLGSPLDALLTVAGPQGNVLGTADDGNSLDPRVQITVPGDIDHVVVTVEDLHRRGDAMFSYRLKARVPRGDFSLQVVPAGPPPPPVLPGTAPPAGPIGPPAINIPRGGLAVAQVNVVRDGYNGPIQLTIPETTAGISAEDGVIPAGASSGLLVLSAAADMPLGTLDLQVAGQGGAATKPIVRPASASRPANAMTDAVVARVPAAICERPPATFTLSERSIRIVHGHNRQLKVTAQRTPEATEAINISGIGLPASVVAGTSGMVAKDANELVLNLNCSPENPVVGPFTMQLLATTKAGDRQETVQLPPVKVEFVRPFSLELFNQNITLKAGAKLRIAAAVRRESPFDGLVKVGPAGSLPQHVALTTVDVPKGEALALLELEVGDLAAPDEMEIPIRASTDMEGRKRDKEYVIPDTILKLKIIANTAP
jgi:hypothetical protein